MNLSKNDYFREYLRYVFLELPMGSGGWILLMGIRQHFFTYEIHFPDIPRLLLPGATKGWGKLRKSGAIRVGKLG